MTQMMHLRVEGDGLQRFANVLAALSEGEMRVIARRALNHTGAKARTKVKRSLAKQTGLKPAQVAKALTVTRATNGNLAFVITGTGDDIPLRYFRPREVRQGVVAYPHGEKRLIEGAFMKGGRFPLTRRVPLPFGNDVFLPVVSTRDWGRPFFRADSGVSIPREMVRGETARVFAGMNEVLNERLSHEAAHSRRLQDLTGGTSF